MDGRMPVIAAIKRWRQFPGLCGIGITIQCVANVVWVLFVDARKSKVGEPLSRLDVELTGILGSRTHREKEERGAQSQFHRLIL